MTTSGGRTSGHVPHSPWTRWILRATDCEEESEQFGKMGEKLKQLDGPQLVELELPCQF